jgi:hypothetical protein
MTLKDGRNNKSNCEFNRRLNVTSTRLLLRQVQIMKVILMLKRIAEDNTDDDGEKKSNSVRACFDDHKAIVIDLN